MNYLCNDLFLWCVCLLCCCCSGHFSFMALWKNDKVDVNFKCRTINPVTTHIRTLRGFAFTIVQELCESRGGRPGLSVLTSLPVSVDVKLYSALVSACP